MKIETITRGYINTHIETFSEFISNCNTQLDELYVEGTITQDDWFLFDRVALRNVKHLDLSEAFLGSDGMLTTSAFPHPSNEHSIESIILPKKMYKISSLNPAFSGFDCPNLKKIEIDSANPVFATRDGCLYSKDFSILYCVPNAGFSEFTILQKVKKLHLCFFRNDQLKILHVPKTPPELCYGDRTFFGLKLNSIDLLVPSDSYTLYKETDVWKEFNIITE